MNIKHEHWGSGVGWQEAAGSVDATLPLALESGLRMVAVDTCMAPLWHSALATGRRAATGTRAHPTHHATSPPAAGLSTPLPSLFLSLPIRLESIPMILLVFLILLFGVDPYSY